MKQLISLSVIVKVVLALLVAVWFFFYYFVFEVEEVTRNKGYSKEALRNPFLAAEMFLSELDVKSQYVKHLEPLDQLYLEEGEKPDYQIGDNDTIVLLNAHGTLNGDAYYNLWDWMAAGGTVVLSMENPFMGEHRYDEFAESLGVVPQEVELLEEIDDGIDEGSEDDEADEDFEDKKDDSPSVKKTDDEKKQRDAPQSEKDRYACGVGRETWVEPPNNESAFTLWFTWGEYFSLEDDMASWVAREAREDGAEYIVAAKYSIGDGAAYVLKSTHQWKNRTIQCGDNAYFLSTVARPGSKVWFVENHDAPSLFELLKTHLSSVLIAFVLLIVFVLWAAFVRFGPVFQTRSNSRRKFSEHLFASALFVWRMKGSEYLLSVVRRDLEAVLKRKSIQYDKLSAEEKITFIQRYTQLDASQIHKALFADGVEKMNDYLESIKLLKQLKGEL